MIDSRWFGFAAVVGIYYILGPVLVRSTFKFNAQCRPVLIPAGQLPPAIAALFRDRIPQIQNLGFEFVGCYDCGNMAANTRSYIAYFCNRQTQDFANISAVITPKKATGYFEFSTRFSDGSFLETNTNRVLPLSPPNPQVRIFRFPEIADPVSLYRLHRRLIEKYAGGLWPQGEPKGTEIQRLVRVVESYGPRHVQNGYMYLSPRGDQYRLTWKGAFLMTWRALPPTSLVRKALQSQAMRAELKSLQAPGIVALQKV
jgi:hypothetical protein